MRAAGGSCKLQSGVMITREESLLELSHDSRISSLPFLTMETTPLPSFILLYYVFYFPFCISRQCPSPSSLRFIIYCVILLLLLLSITLLSLTSTDITRDVSRRISPCVLCLSFRAGNLCCSQLCLGFLNLPVCCLVCRFLTYFYSISTQKKC